MAVRATYLPDPISELESITLRERLIYWEETSGVSLVADSGLADEILDGTYVRLCASSEDLKDFTVVEVFSASDIHDKPIVVQGENTTVEEGTFQGMEATYLTQNYDGRTQYNLVLYDASHDCVIHIGAGAGSEIGFEELEQVAAGLELVDTGIPDASYSNWDWTVINVGAGDNLPEPQPGAGGGMRACRPTARWIVPLHPVGARLFVGAGFIPARGSIRDRPLQTQITPCGRKSTGGVAVIPD